MAEFNELYSIQLVMLVGLDRRKFIPSLHSAGTESLIIASETAFHYGNIERVAEPIIQAINEGRIKHGRELIEQLLSNNQLGIEKAKRKVLRDPEKVPMSDIEHLYTEIHEYDYVEPHGKIKGTIFNKMSFVAYFARTPLAKGDFWNMSSLFQSMS